MLGTVKYLLKSVVVKMGLTTPILRRDDSRCFNSKTLAGAFLVSVTWKIDLRHQVDVLGWVDSLTLSHPEHRRVKRMNYTLTMSIGSRVLLCYIRPIRSSGSHC